jgi:thimet oligopeptidase
MKIFSGLASFLALILLASSSTPSAQASGPNTLYRFTFNDGEIAQLCDEALAEATRELSEIATLRPSARTSRNTLLRFEEALARLEVKAYPPSFLRNISPVPAIREASSLCHTRLSAFLDQTFSRKDLYEALSASRPRSANERRLKSETLKKFEKAGLNLSQTAREQLLILKEKIAQLENEFLGNFSRLHTETAFSESDLEGLTTSDLARLKKDSAGLYRVTTQDADFNVLATKASKSETRKRIFEAYYARTRPNQALLEQLIALRSQAAQLAGKATWADYQTQHRMVGSGRQAIQFLEDLKVNLSPLIQATIAKLLALKKAEHPGANELNAWDLPYYIDRLQRSNGVSIDVREYFPVDGVVARMAGIYSDLLGLRILEIKGAATWDTDVKLYEVRDDRGDRVIGHFYTDLYGREGKYATSGAAYQQIWGRRLPNGKFQQPLSIVLCNFKRTPEGSARLTHAELITLFHEFGHVMHQLLSRAPYASLSGTKVVRDFPEAPSQMLENWIWFADVLVRVSSHFRTGDAIPRDIALAMVRGRADTTLLSTARLLAQSLFDLKIHSIQPTEKLDLETEFGEFYEGVLGVKPGPLAQFGTSFRHLAIGMDGGYYTYLWSRVYAQDMFTRFESGLFNQRVGADYRKWILEPGGMLDARDLVRGFLGREPNSQAFYRMFEER